MPENFFKRHQYTFAGIGAIAAVAAGVFTFVGNSSTRNEISDNSGTVIGVGEQVTLETGAVTINEYDGNAELKRAVKSKLSAAHKECGRLSDVWNRTPRNNLQIATIDPLYKVLDYFDADVMEALPYEVVRAMQDTLQNDIALNAQYVSIYTGALERSRTDAERQGQHNAANAAIKSSSQSNPDFRFDEAFMDYDEPLQSRLDKAFDNVSGRIDTLCADIQTLTEQI